ncbi:MAG: hypothetical protein AAF565_17340, partial [Pseudomonadota bacterium]
MTLHDQDLAQSLAAVIRPVEEANGLPNALYTDQSVADMERSAVFFASWAAIGFAHDVAAPGDVKPLTF